MVPFSDMVLQRSTVCPEEEQLGADEGMLLVALGCGRLPGMLDIMARHGLVVLGTMEDRVLEGLADSIAAQGASALRVYFYETG
jgi:hypothetical protein